ncbi:MAG: hypothetical protein HDT27_09385, partial [Subdoligranulum sp.]|nr:hypothetical protein [Subdoligranulum sp.]
TRKKSQNLPLRWPRQCGTIAAGRYGIAKLLLQCVWLHQHRRIRHPAPFYGYNGEQHDPTTGLQYLRARYYAPQNGSFSTQDSFAGLLTDALSQKRYTYVQNNPVTFADPSGHSIWGSIKNEITNVANAVKNTVTSAANTVKNNVTSAYNVVKNTVTNTYNAVKNTLTGAANQCAHYQPFRGDEFFAWGFRRRGNWRWTLR